MATGWLRRGRGLVVAFSTLAACGSDGSNDQLPGAVSPQTGPREGVAVGHDRELRGAWISTVYNDTWPSTTGLNPAQAQTELIGILDVLAAARMNVVFFQVRPESDAVYASTLEPWSRFLTGTQGGDPGWDPLRFAVDEGHRRGLEVHAWLNPYRGLVDANAAAAPTHVTKTLPDATVRYGTQLWMDPGAPAVRAHILDVVRDILTRYDVDGIHFDDYFYPYPVDGASFNDTATYAAYTSAGGSLTKDDWRRSNVDALVKETADLVTRTRADARFGISPFGIYRPGMPPGITGLDAWATLYCDPVKWMHERWVDYVAPQLYWPTTQPAQSFEKLVGWWAGLSEGGRAVFVGHDATKAGQGAFTLEEYDAEMRLVRAARPQGVMGSVFFSAKPLVSDQVGLRSMLMASYWQLPAATPTLPSATGLPAGEPPRVTLHGPGVIVSLESTTRSLAIYRGLGDRYAIDRLVPSSSSTHELEVKLDRGRWAISLIDRRGLETAATVVEL